MSRQGNTKLSANAKSRNWCFTLNNYTEEEIKNLEKLECKYIFQEEKGENGTPHLQGLLMFSNAVYFNSVKKMLPRAHIERCKNKVSSIKYCTKPETRVGVIRNNCSELGKYWHNGTKKIKKVKKVPSQDVIDGWINEHIEESKRDGTYKLPIWKKIMPCCVCCENCKFRDCICEVE